MDFKGEFKAGTYKPGDVVLLNRVAYLKIGAAPNVTPADTTQWLKLGGATNLPGLPGPRGKPGQGLPPGGTVGQVPVKQSGTNFDVDWQTFSGGGLTREEAIALIFSLT